MKYKSTGIKVLAVICAIAVVLCLVLVAAGFITWKLFWVIAILTAVVAYVVIPWLKKESD